MRTFTGTSRSKSDLVAMLRAKRKGKSVIGRKRPKTKTVQTTKSKTMLMKMRKMATKKILGSSRKALNRLLKQALTKALLSPHLPI